MSSKEPFNCARFSPKLFLKWQLAGVGKADPRTWCMHIAYAPFVGTCLAKRNLTLAAQVQYSLTKAGVYGNQSADLDGSFCFLEGFCDDDEITNATTLQEAEQICDRRYQRTNWASFMSATQYWGKSMRGGGKTALDGREGGFRNTTETRPFTLASCAMGSYHCEVMLCKETYCKKDKFIEKFGHLRRKML